jgi:RNA polymerase sigma-70 factor (ECF subfamily)
MPDDPAFADLMAGVRRGDARAAEVLYRQFEAQVRLEVEMRLRDPRMRSRVESADVCQSVMLSFFIRARLGEYDFADPQELLRLMVGMARNKLVAQARRHQASKRDYRRSVDLDGAAVTPARDASPSEVVANDELLREIRGRLSAEERRITDLRAAGRSWGEIADEMGGTADARRVQLQRAANRVGRELGLEEDDE